MYQDHTPLQIAGQLLLAFAFLATGVRNAGWKFRQHLDRMLAYRVPAARVVLTAGLALQFVAIFIDGGRFRTRCCATSTCPISSSTAASSAACCW